MHHPVFDIVEDTRLITIRVDYETYIRIQSLLKDESAKARIAESIKKTERKRTYRKSGQLCQVCNKPLNKKMYKPSKYNIITCSVLCYQRAYGQLARRVANEKKEPEQG